MIHVISKSYSNYPPDHDQKKGRKPNKYKVVLTIPIECLICEFRIDETVDTLAQIVRRFFVNDTDEAATLAVNAFQEGILSFHGLTFEIAEMKLNQCRHFCNCKKSHIISDIHLDL